MRRVTIAAPRSLATDNWLNAVQTTTHGAQYLRTRCLLCAIRQSREPNPPHLNRFAAIAIL